MTTWTIDPVHTSASFAVQHMMISKVRGNIRNASGTIIFDKDNPAASSVEVTLPADTIDTKMADRDAHLKSPDFLNVAEYPNITFKSTHIDITGENTGRITGDLTIRDVTKAVVLEVEFIGEVMNPLSQERAVGFIASTSINREDWGLTWNVALEAGGVLVGKTIEITIDAEATEAVTESTDAATV